jgi:outer membrane murein-binding lipoprotein Lpp
MPRTKTAPILAAALALPALLAGCDDGARVDSIEGEVTELRSQVKKLEGERDKLAARLENAERRMGGLQEDLLAVRKSADAAGVAAAAAGAKEEPAVVAGAPVAAAPGAPALKGDPKTVQAAQDLANLLASDAGRTVFEGAMRQVEQKREEERGARLATGLVDAFAQRANLSPQQTEQMRKIVGKSISDIGAVWRSMNDGELTPEERATKRQEAFAKTEEIRKTTEDEVKGVLDAQQFEMFQQESARMRGFMGGGGPGGRGGFGGPGGFGGAGGAGGGRGQ